MAEIQRNLPKLRGAMSARELSLAAGLSKGHVWMIEAGKVKSVELATLSKIAAVLGVRPVDLDPDLGVAGQGPVDVFVNRIASSVRVWAEAELAASRIPDDVENVTALDVLEGAWRRKGGVVPSPARVDVAVRAEPITVRRAGRRERALSTLRDEYVGNSDALAWIDAHRAAFAGEVDWLDKLRRELRAFLKGKTAESRAPVDEEETRQIERTARIVNRTRRPSR